MHGVVCFYNEKEIIMRKELENKDMELVSGGTVVVTDTGKVGFTTLGKKYKLQGVDWKTARSYAEDLLDSNPQMSDREFDEFVLGRFQDKGWI